MEKIDIREYREADCEKIACLFLDTVYTINGKDYTKDQLEAWTEGKTDIEWWGRSFKGRYALVAVRNGTIIGFGDMDKSGYLDRLYVHKDFQRRGAATALCRKLEERCPGRITTHASVTARPFFEKRGYRVVRKQQVKRKGIILINFVMEKRMK